MAGLLDPRQGDGTYVENRPSRGQLLWGILEPYVMGPVNAWQGLRDADLNTLLYDTGPRAQQAVENSFNVAGTVAGGSSVVPKPDNALNMGIKAFHGSPHDFDRFSLDKIGTGEGAQAYGHGLYFAENEDVARGYRDALKPGKGTGPEDTASRVLDMHGGDRDAAMAALRESIDRANAQNAPYEEVQRLMMAKTILNTTPERASGRMYEVEIDADPDAFLDWDKPLSEQPEAVRQSLAKFDPDMYSPEGADYDPTELGQIAYQRMFHDTRKKIGPNQGAKTYQAEISKTLREAGIPGIKYLDAGSRVPSAMARKELADWQAQLPVAERELADATAKGDKWLIGRKKAEVKRVQDGIARVSQEAEGTRNYVVFDDNLINIIRKYGIAGLLGGSAAMDAMMSEQQNTQ